jgi:hypothetical protein
MTLMSSGSFSGKTRTDSKRRSKDYGIVLTVVFGDNHKKLDQLRLKNFQIFYLLKLVIQI